MTKGWQLFGYPTKADFKTAYPGPTTQDNIAQHWDRLVKLICEHLLLLAYVVRALHALH